MEQVEQMAPDQEMTRLLIDDKHRAIVNHAMMFAINWSIEEIRKNNDGHVFEKDRKNLVQYTVEYLKSTIPETIKYFQPTLALNIMVEARINSGLFEREDEVPGKVDDGDVIQLH